MSQIKCDNCGKPISQSILLYDKVVCHDCYTLHQNTPKRCLTCYEFLTKRDDLICIDCVHFLEKESGMKVLAQGTFGNLIQQEKKKKIPIDDQPKAEILVCHFCSLEFASLDGPHELCPKCSSAQSESESPLEAVKTFTDEDWKKIRDGTFDFREREKKYAERLADFEKHLKTEKIKKFNSLLECMDILREMVVHLKEQEQEEKKEASKKHKRTQCDCGNPNCPDYKY